MARYDAIVVISGRCERGWIASTGLHVLHGRVLIEEWKLLRIGRRSVFGRPGTAACKSIVTEHVHDADGRQRNGKQIRPLLLDGTDEQSTVRSTADGELRRRCVLFLDQMLGNGNEVVEHVLLL